MFIELKSPDSILSCGHWKGVCPIVGEHQSIKDECDPLQACRMGPWDVAWHCPLDREGRSDTMGSGMAFSARNPRKLRGGQARLLSMAAFLRRRKPTFYMYNQKSYLRRFKPERESTGKRKRGQEGVEKNNHEYYIPEEKQHSVN